MPEFRKFRKSDVPELVRVANTIAEHEGEESRISEAYLNHLFAAPHVAPEEDFETVTDDKGVVIGGVLCVFNPRMGMVSMSYLMHPDYRGTGLQATMVERSLTYAREKGEQVIPADKPIFVGIGVRSDREHDVKTLEAAGFEEVRRFYMMAIDLDVPIEKPELPDGLALRPFDPDKHAQAVHQAQQESFRDHWGHVEDSPYIEWAHQLSKNDFDPSLWFIAWDGEEVAGVCLSEVSNSKPNTGYVDILGVRREWRKRGLGMALLRHSFHVFQQRDMKRVELGVDSDSRTNAVALYERAGMQVDRVTITYGHVLRGSLDDIGL